MEHLLNLVTYYENKSPSIDNMTYSHLICGWQPLFLASVLRLARAKEIGIYIQAEAHRLFEARVLAQRLNLVDRRASCGFWFSSIHFRGQISMLTYRKRNRAGNPVYRYLPVRVKTV